MKQITNKEYEEYQKYICDGEEEELKPGCCHICPQGSEHSIINTVEEDLVLLTVVVHR